jgi:hypothetical protein
MYSQCAPEAVLSKPRNTILTSSSWPRSVADSLKSPMVEMRGVARRRMLCVKERSGEESTRMLLAEEASTPGGRSFHGASWLASVCCG